MGWTDPPRRYFLAAGKAAQFSFSFIPNSPPFPQLWAGPQLAVARADPAAGATHSSTLVTQWQGTQLSVSPNGRRNESYLLGIQNASAQDVWFHLEGGRLT
jgi:hypothetical protein